MFLELGGLLLIMASCAIVGLILLNICSKKNPESTKRVFSDVLIGMTAGGAVMLMSYFEETIWDNMFTLIFGFLILVCILMLFIGVMAVVIVFLIGGRAH